MTVKELKEFLNEIPDNAIIVTHANNHTSGSYFSHGDVKIKEVKVYWHEGPAVLIGNFHKIPDNL